MSNASFLCPELPQRRVHRLELTFAEWNLQKTKSALLQELRTTEVSAVQRPAGRCTFDRSRRSLPSTPFFAWRSQIVTDSLFISLPRPDNQHSEKHAGFWLASLYIWGRYCNVLQCAKWNLQEWAFHFPINQATRLPRAEPADFNLVLKFKVPCFTKTVWAVC